MHHGLEEYHTKPVAFAGHNKYGTFGIEPLQLLLSNPASENHALRDIETACFVCEPTLITTGTRDLLLSHSVRLARVMREAGVDVDLRIWEGLWHVFEFYDEIPEAALSLRQIGEFLTERFEKEKGRI